MVHRMTALTLDEAQRNLPDAVQKALKGEEVAIQVGGETVRLVHDVPVRPPGYFAECYQNAEDEAFEERICSDSKPILDE
jgi:antitoxin (DNA-binding transcriptional repressor) of toxin-antitoxin stability system